jgi:protoporphyrin/coproporphyrin ferrochelatase
MAKRGLLLINLGSPAKPEPKEVRAYLNEFLMDPYVIDIPAPLRWVLVRAIIAPTRAPKSAEAYKKIWRANGSPLVHYTREFAAKVARELGSDWEVRWAMRYGSPSIQDTAKNWSVDEIVTIPLYPQYAESSTRTAIETARKVMPAKTKYLRDFHAQPAFIESQAQVIQTELERFKPDHLLLSFHGLPEHHVTKIHPDHCLKSPSCCDELTERNALCYRAQTMATVRALKLKLSFPSEKISVSFQSRLGRRPWIKPYTDIVVDDLAKSGVRRLAVSCPSFIADCLETLEEIQMRLKEQFIAAGGQDLVLIPAVNDSDDWVRRFALMVKDFQKLPLI